MSCEKCINESRIDNSFTRQPLQKPGKPITGPEGAMKLIWFRNYLRQVATET